MRKKNVEMPDISITCYRSEYYNGPLYHLYVNSELEVYQNTDDLQKRLYFLINLTINEVST